MVIHGDDELTRTCNRACKALLPLAVTLMKIGRAVLLV